MFEEKLNMRLAMLQSCGFTGLCLYYDKQGIKSTHKEYTQSKDVPAA